MNEGNRRMELLGSAPIPKALLAMGLPAMIGMMINALYNLVDAYFVGGLGTSQMGAISVAFPLGQIVVGLGLLFGNGAASYISRLLGYGEKETANKAASTALYGSLLAGAVMIVCALLFLEPVLILLGATESILPYALAYAGIYTASSIFNVFNVTMNSIVTSEGAARTTMCALMAGAGLNPGSGIYLCSGTGGYRSGNRHRNFPGGVCACVFTLRITERKCLYLPCSRLLFYWENHIGNYESRHSHPGIPASDRSVHNTHQFAG